MICDICFSAEPCHIFFFVDNTETSEVCQNSLKTQVSNMVVCEEKHIQACRLMVTLISVIELGICATKEATKHTKGGKLTFSLAIVYKYQDQNRGRDDRHWCSADDITDYII